MGIDKDAAKFLLSARERKVSFQKTLMLGNQQFHLAHSDYKILTDTFKLKDFAQIKTSNDFFSLLGAEEVSALDMSDYDGATILHDLNQPIGDELKEKFTFVFDGGTLEHIFNFPNALANVMKMVKVGGHLVIITVGNNFLGHGFYQFSPELFYRALSAENGFTVNRLVVAEVGGNWYEAADPQQIKSRVELINDKPIYLIILAEKQSSKPLFVNVPQQSDYVEMWHGTTDGQKNNDSSNSLKNLLKKNKFVYRTLVQIKQNHLSNILRREKSFANSKAYKLVDK